MKNYITEFVGSRSDIKKAQIVLNKIGGGVVITGGGFAEPTVVKNLSNEYKLHTPAGIDSIEDIERWADSRDVSTAEARAIFAASETMEHADQIWENNCWWVIDEEAIEAQMRLEGWNGED